MATRVQKIGWGLATLPIASLVISGLVTTVCLLLLPVLANMSCCSGSRHSTAKADARAIKGAATIFRYDSVSCPTVNDLIADGKMDADTDSEDPWGTPYAIKCCEDTVVVSSAGQDRQWGTDDDLRTAQPNEEC